MSSDDPQNPVIPKLKLLQGDGPPFDHPSTQSASSIYHTEFSDGFNTWYVGHVPRLCKNCEWYSISKTGSIETPICHVEPEPLITTPDYWCSYFQAKLVKMEEDE